LPPGQSTDILLDNDTKNIEAIFPRPSWLRRGE
jgi:hypothetical protein